MRYLLLIFKARNPETFAAGWRAVRRKLGQLYIRFCKYLVIFHKSCGSPLSLYRYGHFYRIRGSVLLPRHLLFGPLYALLYLGSSNLLQRYTGTYFSHVFTIGSTSWRLLLSQFHRSALLKKYVVGMTLTRLCIPMCMLNVSFFFWYVYMTSAFLFRFLRLSIQLSPCPTELQSSLLAVSVRF